LERAKAAEAAARQEAEATAAARRPVLAAIMRDYTVSEQDRQRLLRQTQDGSLPPEVWAHYERMAATAATAPAPAPGPAPGPAAGSVPTGSEFRDLTGVREAAPAPDVPSGASHAPAAAAAAWSARPPPPPADEELDAEASTFMSKEQRSTLDLACREILASPGILAEMGFSRALGVFLGQILAATGLEKTLLRYAAHRTLLAILSGPDPVGSAEGGLSPERREALIRAMLEQAPPAPDMALLRYQRAQGAQSAAASVATETASFGLAAKLKAKQASTSKLAASAAAWTPKPRAPSSRPVPAAAAPKPAAAAPKPAAPKPAARAPPRADPPRLRGEGAWTTVKAKPKGGGRGRGQVGAARGHAPPVVGEERGGVWVESGQRAAADYGAGGLRAAAVAAHGRMETFFAVAAEAHRHGDGARAAEMARRGRAAKAEMEAAHARASAAILARRTAQLPESARASTLDLHGQHLREGLTLLEARVAAARAEGRRSLTVITGAGLHTEVYGGRRRTATLRERVASWLRDSGLRFREAGGSGAGAGAGGTFTVSL
jgi:DNA-nicking Smr family endonuclease